MVRPLALAVFLLAASVATAQDTPGDQGPTLYGDGGGRLWKWQDGEKTLLTPEGRNLVLGGVGATSLWGWSIEGTQARFFTLELPKKKAAAKDAKPVAPPAPVFDRQTFPAPDKADVLGDRRLLVYGPGSPQRRWELWQAGTLVEARAYDDGRVVYSAALGPTEGYLLAGRSAEGRPWLEVSGQSVEAPEGWRGRFTVAAWWTSQEDNGLPAAAGWGALPGQPAQPLFWGREGFTVPAPAEGEVPAAGVYPVLGTVVEAGLALAGWQADATGQRVWFWDGTAPWSGGSAEGQPVAFSLGGKGGAFLVVRHPAAPWFTQEDGKTSTPLAGLEFDDRVVAIGVDEISK